MSNDKFPYIRVGNSYYKQVKIPLLSGDFNDSYVKWNSEFIKQDHGKTALSSIPKYDGWTVQPEHFTYKQQIGNFLNKYQPFNHKPMKKEWNNIEYFMKHIFQNQYELGLDYITLLLNKPTQTLPILCLVSKERSTGKSTFILFLKAIFSGNMSIISNSEFASQFNSDWIGKLLVAVDETFMDKKEDSERLKNLSTAKLYKSESKGVDRVEVEFFGKFILCSNNEDDFITIEPLETRYWVIKVYPFENEIVDFLGKLKSEIPGFLDFLLNRDLHTKNETRMWFNPALLVTPALQKVIRRGRNKLEIELLHLMLHILEVKELDDISFCISDVQDWLNFKRHKPAESIQLKRIFQNDWKLEPSTNSNSYKKYKFFSDGSIIEDSAKGRFYKMSKESIIKLSE